MGLVGKPITVRDHCQEKDEDKLEEVLRTPNHDLIDVAVRERMVQEFQPRSPYKQQDSS